jgi:serine/threonine-protein phosphatase 2A regulatory subunit B
VFDYKDDPNPKTFFSEIITSINDIKFSGDGRYIVSRDFLTLKVWDIKMATKPVAVLNVHDHLKAKLCELYDNDCIFDKFETTFNGSGS